MKMKNNSINVIYLFIIFGMIGNWYPVNAELSDIHSMRQFAADSYDIMKSIYDDAESASAIPSTTDIMDKVEDIISPISRWDSGLKEKEETINRLILGLSSVETIEQEVHNLTKYIGWIDEMYGEFKKFVETPDSLDEETAGELSEIYTSQHEQDLIGTIREMFSLISPDAWGNYKRSLFFIVARKTQKDALKLCGVGSPQQRLVDYYSVIVITEMRALTMINFGYLMKGFKENASYLGDMERANEQFIQRVEKYLLIIRKALKVAAKKIRSCDPPEGHTRGESFHEFERFIQSVVLDEMTLASYADCRDTCDTLPNPTKTHTCDGIGCHAGVPVCQGFLRNCKTLNWKADFCENNDNAIRRYQWVLDGWGSYHPHDAQECKGKYHWPRWHRIFIYDCDICNCLCVEEAVASPSNHFISLREQLSDVADNMVIVGLRFRVVNKILHIDIQQAPLGYNGTIDGDKVQWKALEDIQYDRERSIQSGWRNFKFYKNNEDGEREEMIKDKDVAALIWDFRRINLDTLTSPPGHIITGIRFARYNGAPTQPIYLEIQATPFDIESGQLDSGNSLWIGPKDTSYGMLQVRRTAFKADGSRNPEKSRKTAIDTKPNTFIDLYWSNWDYDASQATIPFLDAREVSFNPPIGLTGVGLYHKSQNGYGGFLTFVVEAIDIASSIKNPRRSR